MHLTRFCRLLLPALFIALSAKSSQIIYVNASAPAASTQNGLTWSNAYFQLSSALQTAAGEASASQPVEIWVAAGTYTPTAGTDRTQSFALPSYVTIRGGFAGTETSLGQRPASGYYTVLSGDIGETDLAGVTATNVGAMLTGTLPFPPVNAGVNNSGYADNSYNVITCEGVSNVVLDTVIITGGNANNTDANGAQIRTLGDLDGMTEYNFNDTNEAAVGSPLVLPDPVVSGGGIYVTNYYNRAANQMTLTLTNCVFVHNTATYMGGAIMAYAANLSFSGCQFIANAAQQQGGAFGSLDNIYSLENCLFSNNAAFYFGGAVYFSSLPVTSPDTPSGASIIKSEAKSQAIGTGIKIGLTAAKAAFSKATGLGLGVLADNSVFITTDPENVALNNVTAAAEEDSFGVGDVYSIVGVAVSVGSLAGDLAIAFGGNPNSPAYKGWVQASTFFNTYLNPVGILTLIADATGGQFLTTVSHQPSPQDLQNQYMQEQLGEFNTIAYSTVKDCTFQDNFASGEGGAVVVVYDNAEFDRCWFLTNSAVSTAGAAGFIGWNTPRVFNCAFSGNTSTNGYSAVYNSFHARTQIINDTFVGNSSLATNGECVGSELGSIVKVYNSILWGNTDVQNPAGGADLFVATSQNISPDVYNAYSQAGPAQGDYVATLDLRASTVQSLYSLPQGWDDYELYSWNADSFVSNTAIQFFQQADQNGFADLAGYCNVGEGIRPGSFTVIQSQNYWLNDANNPYLTGQGGVVLLQEPYYLEEGLEYLFGFSASFNITQPLPTFSAGDENLPNGQAGFFSGPNTFDTYNTAQLYDVFDAQSVYFLNRGCVQYQGEAGQGQKGLTFDHYYVRQGAPAGGNGGSWTNAFSSLAPVLNNGIPGGVQVWVAKGTYTDSGQLPPGIVMYGGFAGSETALAQRNLAANPTLYSGGMECLGQTLLDGLTVTNYHSAGYPAIYSQSSGYLLTANNCAFINNSGLYGGAVYWQGPVAVSNSQFTANSTTSTAGGAINANELTALNCSFMGNSSGYAGGAIAFYNSIEAVNCLFAGNNAPQGAAIEGWPTDPSTWQLYNDTFYGNGAATVCILGSYDPRFPALGVTGPAPSPVNCLFWGNTSDGLPPQPTDPLFLDAPALNFELSANSPDIGTGVTNGLPANFPAIDLEGAPRIINGRLDPGAFEYPSLAGFQGGIQISLSGTNQVFSSFVGEAVIHASVQWQIYSNGAWVNLANNSIYQGVNSLQLTVAVNPSLYGYQYRLTGIVDGTPIQLSPVGLINATPSGVFYVRANATGSGDGSSWQNAFTSLSSVFLGLGNSGPVEVWVAAGTYTGASLSAGGNTRIYGGFAGTETDLSQRNVTNNPTIFTGSISCDNSFYVDGFIFTNSQSADYAPIASANSGYQLTANNCLFTHNTNGYGGAIYWLGPVVVSNCQFTANSTPEDGGAVYGNEVTALNCYFASNSAGFQGGAVWFSDYAQVINCAFIGNNSGNGSAVFANSTPAGNWNLYNDTFYGNGSNTFSSPDNAAGVQPVNCLFWQDTSNDPAMQAFPGYAADPFFVAPTTGNLQLNAWSPAIGDAATGNLPANFPATDLAGHPRLVNGRLDLGAYEFQGTVLPPPAFSVVASSAYLVDGLYGPYYNFTAFDLSPTTNEATASLQWQAYSNNVWSNVANNSVYQGATSQQLFLYNPAAALTNNEYRLTGTAANGAYFELSPVTLPWTNLATSYAISQTGDGGFNSSGQWGPVDNLSASLGAAAAGASLQWQVYSNGVWVNLGNGSLYQGVNSQQLSIVGPSASMNGYQYRLTGTSTNGTFMLAPSTIATGYPLVYYVDGTRGYAYYTNWVATHSGSAPTYNGASWATAFPTLHEALALAQPGAEIWVRAGTYYPLRTLGVDGYSLPAALALPRGARLLGGFTGTETSDTQRNWQAHLTIINCNSNAPGDDPNLTEYHYAASPSVFVNGPNVGNDSVVDGFTLTAATAGAIVNPGGSPTIENCTFVNNVAAQGAAVGSWSNASPVILNCVLSTNVAQQGTLYFNNASGLVENCLLSYNNSFLNGTVYGTNATVSLLNSAVVFNNAAGGTGGIVTAGGSVSLMNSILWGNAGTQLGGTGGMNIGYSCVQGGSTTNYNFAIDPVFALPASNNFQLLATSPLLNFGNTVAAAGLNTDLNGNTREVNGHIDIGPYEYQSAAGFALAATSLPYALAVTNFGTYSLVAGGLPSSYNNIQWQVSAGGVFVPVTNSAQLNYGTNLSGNNASLTLYLTNGVNTYNSLNGLLYRFIEPDLNFTSPPALLTVQVPEILFVNAAASGPTQNGLSWSTAFTNLNPALAAAATTNVGAIWIARGTYALPASAATVKTALDGGFAGNETQLSQRNWTTNVTTLTATGCAVSGTLDGFTVQGSGSLSNSLVVNSAAPAIQNCVFTGGNTQVAVNLGLPAFANCVFSNAATALTITAGNASVTNCSFTGLANGVTATGNTAGAALSHCVFTGNTGVSLQDQAGAGVIVRDSLFTGNTGDAIVHHGAQGGTMSVINCTLTGNVQPNGVITAPGNTDAAGLQVANSILWNNTSTRWAAYVAANPSVFTPDVDVVFSNADVAEIDTYVSSNYLVYAAQALAAANAGQNGAAAADQNVAQQYATQNASLLSAVTYNCIQGLAFFSTNSNINDDPLFTNPGGGNYLPGSWSPAQDAGNSSLVPAGDTDLAGNPRVYGPAVDLGAYEVQTTSLGVIGLAQNPLPVTLTVPNAASFTAAIAMNSSLTNYVWQMNNGSGWTTVVPNSVFSISNNANATTLFVNPVDLTLNNAQFRLAALPITYAGAAATLNALLSPLNATLNQQVTTTAILPVGANAANYVWQYNSSTGWVTIASGPQYSIGYSGNTSILIILAASPVLNGQYRLAASNGSFTSAPVTLTTYVPPVLYVNAAATGNGLGTNWANAFTNPGNALGVAQPGEQVWVAAGTYPATNAAGSAVTWPLTQGVAVYGGFAGTETSFAQRNWNANPTVLSAGGSAAILHGQASSSHSPALLDGFIVTGGSTEPALTDIGVAATLQNCVFTNNLAGAIANANALATVSNCVFTANGATNGAAILASGGTNNLLACQFFTNSATLEGGAVCAQSTTLNITNCVFTGNTAGDGGGALNLTGANAELGLVLSSLTANTASNGGAVYFSSSSGVACNLADDLVAENQAIGQGGGIDWSETNGDQLFMDNCTIADNTSGGQGGGLWDSGANGGGNGTLYNNIFWGNHTESGDSIEFQQVYNAEFIYYYDVVSQHFPGAIAWQLFYYNNILQGLDLYNKTSVPSTGVYVQDVGGNISVDPAFANAVAGNFQLQSGSPAINAGNNYGLVIFDLNTDLAGNPRIYGGTVDIGAYEVQTNQTAPFQSAVLPGSQSVCNNGSTVIFALGTSGSSNLANAVWQINTGAGFADLATAAPYSISSSATNLTLTIQPATLAMNGYQFRLRVNGYVYTTPPATLTVGPETVVYVNAAATGNNSGTNWANAYTNLQSALSGTSCAQIWVAQGTYTIPTNANGATSFRLRQFLDLRGGFNGTETNVNQRNYAGHPTILAAIGNQSIFFNDGTAGPIDGTAILDGFLLTGATVNPAVFNLDASPVIRNCVFTNNTSRAIENQGIVTGANGTITNCVFVNNPGGGILNLFSAPTVTGCSFVSNHVAGFGGGMDNEQGSPAVVGCVFTDNTANSGGGFYNNTTNAGTLLLRDTFTGNSASQGGALDNTADSVLTLRDSLLAQNSGSFAGGAIFDSGILNAVNNTIADNTAGYVAGGVWVDSGAAFNAANSILWNNSVNTPGSGLLASQITGGTPVTVLAGVSNSIVEGLSGHPANGNLAYDPLFNNESTGNYQLTGVSPAVDAGSTNLLLAGESDLAGNARAQRSSVDLGAYEFLGNPATTADISLLPQSVSTCASNNVAFTVAAPAADGYTYVWQQASGATFTNLAANAIYTIATTNGAGTLAISNVSAGLSGSTYQVLVQGGSETVTSAVFTLTVNPRSVVYVNSHAAPGGNGASWSSAFVNLADAVAQGGCDDIWIAAGVYTPTNDANSQPVTLSLSEGMRLFGGFAGTETNLSQRNPAANRTVLSAASGIVALEALGTATPIDQSTRVDGLTVTGAGAVPALLFSGASPLLQNCVFTTNSAGAVSCQGGAAPVFIDCAFSNNLGSSAVQVQGASPAFTGCVFAGNQALAGQNGGAIAATVGSTLTLLQCTLTNNTATAAGGAVSVDNSTAEISSSLFTYNTAATAGALSGTDGATLTLINDTIADNSAPTVSGVSISGQGAVTNCILWDNGNSETAELSGNAAVAYSDIEDLNHYSGNDNIPYDPLFVNAAAGQFTLSSGSPGVDTGDNAAVDSSDDLAGGARIQGFAVDMGAYESAGIGQYIQVTQQPVSQTGCAGGVVQFTVAGPANFGSNFIWQVNTGSGFATLALSGGYSITTNNSSSVLTVSNASVGLSGDQFRAAIGNLGLYSQTATLTVLPHRVLYVNAAATGNGSGATWVNAYTNLDPALAAGDVCTEIWVAQGTYASTNHAGGPGFNLASGTAIYGGFAGTETNRAQRNWTANPTRLISAYQTNLVLQIASSGIMDGFIVSGAGIYIAPATLPTVQNCTFVSNSAPAIVNAGGTPTILNCAFATNTAIALLNMGGGAATVSNCVFTANMDGAILNQASSLTVQQSTFTGNTAALGGAVETEGGSPLVLLDHCTFAANNATAEGGAVYNDAGGNLTVADGLFYGNNAQNGGGVANAGQTIILSSTFSGNSANLAGGGIYGPQGSVTVTNSILWGDTAGSSSAAELTGSVTASYSLIQNGANTAANDLAYDPQFINPATGNFGLPTDSPAVGVGFAPAAAGITTDLAGHPRVAAWGLDLGAYQSGSSPSQAVTVSTEPTAVSACDGQLTTSLTYVAPATNSTYEWLLNNGGWQTLQTGQTGPDNESYFITTVTNGGLVTSTLTISNVVIGMNDFQYAIGNGVAFMSAPATLTVNEPSVIYVNATAAPGGNGTSWATAFNDLPDAFNAADPCQSVLWVAAGTYSASNLPSGGFQVPYVHSGIKIYGGFAGTETTLSQRSWTNNPTILTGATGGNAVVNFNGTANTIDTNTTLDGFIVTGGGILVADSSPILANDQILSNTGSYGGLTIISNTLPTAPLIENDIFQGNSGSLAGAIYAYGATPILADILVSGNAGVAIVLSNSPATIINATVAGNSNGLVAIGATVYIFNSIFWDNGAAGTNVELGQLSGNVFVGNSCVQGLDLYAGNLNLGNDPLFLAAIQPTQAPSTGGNYHLYASSPAIAAGDAYADYAITVINTDLDGNPRLVNGAVDLGAYEFTGTAATATTVAIPPATTAYAGNAVTLYATVTGAGLTYQWQGNFGQGWVNLTDGSDYSGSTTAALTILNPTLLLNGAQYQVIVTDGSGATTVSAPSTISAFSTTWYVSPTGTNGDGHSWAAAFTNIQSALANLTPGPTNRQIWVAAGTYYADPANTNASIQLPSYVTLLGGFAGTETYASQRNWTANPTILEGSLPGGGNSVILLGVTNQSGVTLDGFTLQDAGLGLAGTNSGLTVANCVFNHNGQAIAAAGGTLSLAACTVANTLNAGNNVVDLQNLNAAITNSLFANNSGEVVANSNCVVVISGCVFTNNPDIGLYNGASSTANVQDTRFVANGIGAYNDTASFPFFTNCTFAGNTHGLWFNHVDSFYAPSPTVDECQFLTNSDSALDSEFSYALVSRSEFRGNSTPAYGGGLLVDGGSVAAIDSLFSGNYSASGGGGLYLTGGGSLQLNNCTIAANSSSGPGAGFFADAYYYNSTIQNCILWDNYGPDGSGNFGYSAEAQFWGTEEYYYNGNQNDFENFPDTGGDPRTLNPAFVAPVFGGGASAPTIAGDFHLGGDSPLIGAGGTGYVNNGSSYGSNIDIITDLDGNLRLNNGTVDLGAYEFQGAPPAATLTVASNATSLVYYPGVAAHNTLTATATGTNLTYQWYVNYNNGQGYVAVTDGTDFNGATSATLTFNTLPPDLNGVQFTVLISSGAGGSIFSTPSTLVINPSQWYVYPTAPAGGNGLSWATAFNDLNTALLNTNLTPAASQIWVAQGTYTANAGYWSVPNGVALIGGFAGNETDPSQRDFSAHPTVLNTGINLHEGAALDGFTLNVSSYSTAIYYASGSTGTNAPLIANCIVGTSGSSATGLSSETSYTTNSMVVTNCQFNNCGVNVWGPLCMYDCTVTNAGVTFYHQMPLSDVFANCVISGTGPFSGSPGLMDEINSYGYPDVIDNCVIVNNSYAFNTFGQAISLFITNSLISGNSQGAIQTPYQYTSLVLDHTIMTNNGPAIVSYGMTNLIVNESLIAGNVGGGNAGAILAPTNLLGTPSAIVIKDSTIAGNDSTQDSGAIDASGNNLFLTNSIIWNNAGPSNVILAASIAGSNNCVQAFTGGFTAGGGNLSLNPLFANTNNGDYHLASASQIRAAGNPALTTDKVDLDGNPRTAGGEIDLGPYQTGVTYSFGRLQPSTTTGFQINLTGTLSSYTVQRSTNLINWSVLGSFTAQGGGQFRFTDPGATNRAHAFYRVTTP